MQIECKINTRSKVELVILSVAFGLDKVKVKFLVFRQLFTVLFVEKRPFWINDESTLRGGGDSPVVKACLPWKGRRATVGGRGVLLIGRAELDPPSGRGLLQCIRVEGALLRSEILKPLRR
jgi:hypothetical protein